MGSLGTRMEQQVKARMDLLSSKGPLSIKRVQLSSSLQDDEDDRSKLLEKLERADEVPMAPQLQCDYFLQFSLVNADDKRYSLFSDYGLDKFSSINWVMTESALPPSSLSWSYHQQAIGLPIPSVANDQAKITLMMPTNSNSGIKGPFDYFNALMFLYERQFDPMTGLLRAPSPGQGFVTLKVGLFVMKVGLRWDEEFLEVPLFELQRVKFGTPQFQFDPKTAQPLMVSLPMSYSNTRWVNLSTVTRSLINFEIKRETLLAPEAGNNPYNSGIIE